MSNSPTHSGVFIGLDRLQRLQVSIAIEACTRYGSLALAESGRATRFVWLDRQGRTAATISPALDKLLAELRASGRALDYVAVTDGPGSFTGLRIGVTTAKTLAYALGCKLVAVDSLATMAWQLWDQQPQATAVAVALNAYRGQVFSAAWTRDQWQTAMQTGDFATQSKVESKTDWIESHSNTSDSTIIAAEPGLLTSVPAKPLMTVVPTAVAVAALGERVAANGRYVTAMELLPRYLRVSAAEEKLE